MSVNHAWLLKGWLLGEPNVPDEIVEAVEAIIASFGRLGDSVTSRPFPVIPVIAQVEKAPGLEFAVPSTGETPAPRQRKAWSPEAKAAAAERMREMQARKKASRLGEARAPSSGGA